MWRHGPVGLLYLSYQAIHRKFQTKLLATKGSGIKNQKPLRVCHTHTHTHTHSVWNSVEFIGVEHMTVCVCVVQLKQKGKLQLAKSCTCRACYEMRCILSVLKKVEAICCLC